MVAVEESEGSCRDGCLKPSAQGETSDQSGRKRERLLQLCLDHLEIDRVSDHSTVKLPSLLPHAPLFCHVGASSKVRSTAQPGHFHHAVVERSVAQHPLRPIFGFSRRSYLPRYCVAGASRCSHPQPLEGRRVQEAEASPPNGPSLLSLTSNTQLTAPTASPR